MFGGGGVSETCIYGSRSVRTLALLSSMTLLRSIIYVLAALLDVLDCICPALSLMPFIPLAYSSHVSLSDEPKKGILPPHVPDHKQERRREDEV